MKKRIYLTALMMAIFVATAISQAPQGINYQAVVRNAQGAILPNTAVSIRLSIHDVSPTGAVVFSETHLQTTNSLGLFNTVIGSGAAGTGTLAGVNWGTGGKYLQVEVDVTGGTNYVDMGTTQLNSVPYALFAASAGGSQGATGSTGAAGSNGNNGATGPTGANGSNGTTGPTGAAGSNGTNGINGATGIAGANGSNGATGPAGTNGTTGPAGANGTNGVAGATGPTGAAGSNGTNGTNGVTGATGPTGIGGGATGATGANGVTGPTGAAGTNGTNGATGPTGIAGTNGTNGVTGANGVTGPTGANGINGATGAAGTNGTNGITGPTGLVGTNGTTGPTGPTGTGGGATGPTGAAGANGSNGATGIAGPTGAAGSNGTNGATGPTGAAGTAGATGAAGTNGTNGANGATGPAGTNGTTGPTGLTGPTGTTGGTGLVGAPGTNGTNGNTGATGATGAAGTNGTNGVTGTTGAAGTNGADGATGPAGPSGVDGINGAAGATGATGATGSPGLPPGTAAGNTTYWDGTQWVVNSNHLYNNGGNIGIGTAAPIATLHLSASDASNPRMLIQNQGNGALVGLVTPTAAYTGGVGTGNYFNFPIFTNDIDRMTITRDGNVGIGTSTPGSLLYVGNGAVPPGALPGINVALNGPSYVTASDGTRSALYGVDNSGYAMVGSYTADDFVIRSSNAERIRILAGGNVGIGTSNPVQALHVFSNVTGGGVVVDGDNSISVTLDVSGVPGAAIGLASAPGSFSPEAQANDLTIRTATGRIIFNTTNGAAASTMTVAGGNVGIGTSTPGTLLQISGPDAITPAVSIENQGNGASVSLLTPSSAATGGVGTDNHFNFPIFTDNQDRMTITADGNVGIGTSTPGALLEVAGQVKITGGAPADGAILTSDANGLASWKTSLSTNPAIAFRAISGTGAALTSDVAIVFDNEVYDAGSNYDASTGIFTAPVAGYYHFDANIRGVATGTGRFNFGFLGSNAGYFGFNTTDANATSDQWLSINASGDTFLNAGETVIVIGEMLGGVTDYTIYANSNFVSFSGHQIH